jgi:hypothetical protein
MHRSEDGQCHGSGDSHTPSLRTGEEIQVPASSGLAVAADELQFVDRDAALRPRSSTVCAVARRNPPRNIENAPGCFKQPGAFGPTERWISVPRG